MMKMINPLQNEFAEDLGSETDKTHGRRIALEAALIAQARVMATKGQTVSEEQVDRWIDSLGTVNELSPPISGS